MISVLLAARKDSKYLAKFLMGYLENTVDSLDVELLVMMHEEDTWNKELVEYLTANEDIMFFTENKGLGRNGLHVYYNDLLPFTSGNWIVYFCEDHFITLKGWDAYVRQIIAGGSRSLKVTEFEESEPLNPTEPWCIVPKFENVGAMNQIVSKGYIKAMGGYLGRHGNIDSYLNDVNRLLPQERIIKMDDPAFYDFTHDSPSPLDDVHTKTPLSEEGKALPKYTDHVVQKWIDEDAEKIRRALDGLQR